MKTRQRVGLAIVLVTICELQLISMGEALEGPGAVFVATVALLCLGVGILMLVVDEEA